MRLLIFGAGASAGSVGLPAARDFGAELARAHPRWTRAYPNLAQVVEGLRVGGPDGDWDLGAAWTRLDYLTKLAWAVQSELDLVAANVEMRKALLDVYGGTGVQLQRSRRRTRTVLQLIRAAAPGDVIVSFNYDLLVEQLAAQHGVDLVQGPCAHPACSRCLQLIKPHGSLAWSATRRRGKTEVHWRDKEGRPLVRPLRKARVDADRLPLVLGVVPIKSELLPEVQLAHAATAVHDAIVRQWRAAMEAASRADAIEVIGYSFPPEDQYGSFLFHEAIRSRPRKPEVSFFELEASAFDVARRLLEVFGVWPTWRRPV